jgi:hypothetical protein
MKKLIILAVAFLLGYAVSAVTLIVWSGMNLYEDEFGYGTS